MDEENEWIDRKLVGVEYPGDIRNADEMIKTLGGIVNISKVCTISSAKYPKRNILSIIYRFIFNF